MVKSRKGKIIGGHITNQWPRKEGNERALSFFVHRCILLQIPLTVFLMVLFGSIGLTMSAYYYDCDPLASGQIEKSDQVFFFIIF